MSKKPQGLHKHTLNLYEGDMEWFAITYPEIGASAGIREVIHQHREKIEAQIEKPELPEVKTSVGAL